MQGYFFRKGLILGVVTLFIGAGIMPNMVKEAKADIAEGLVAYWSFDEGKGNTIHDSSGNNNDGTIDNPRWVPGISGYSLKFDGINDYAIVPDDPSLNFHNTNKFSISLWIKREKRFIRNDEALISKGTHAYKKGYGVNIKRKNDTIEFYVKGGGKEYTCYSNTKIYNNIWCHVVTIWNGQTQWIYINGTLDNTQNLTNFTIDDDHKPLEIGNHYHTDNYHPFHGILDEVLIYNRALTESEIQHLYIEGGGNVQVNINKPKQGTLYLEDKELLSIPFLRKAIIIGPITIDAEVSHAIGAAEIEFYIDGLKSTDNIAPYSYVWNESAFGLYRIEVVVHDSLGRTATDSITVFIINLRTGTETQKEDH